MNCPNKVIMTQHAGFRIASSATGIDQSAAFTCSLLGNLLVDSIIAYFLAQVKEVLPYVESFIFDVTR
jgi:hypothetical protein